MVAEELLGHEHLSGIPPRHAAEIADPAGSLRGGSPTPALE